MTFDWKAQFRYFPATNSKRPRDTGWQQQATNDPVQVERWRIETPYLGIKCGAESNVFALDVDCKRADGFATLATLEKKHQPLPQTCTVRTPSGGQHRLFKHCSGLKNAVEFLPGLDVRTEGGLVIAAGSPGYECLLDIEPAEAPAWLIMEIIKGQGTADHNPPPVKVPEGGILAGQRNDTLFRLGSAFRNKGMTHPAIEAALLAVNQESCNPPLSIDEIRIIARQAAKYEAGALFQEHATDLGNAQRLARLHGHDLRYSFEQRRWYVWDGKRWAPDRLDEVRRRAKQAVRALYQEAQTLSDEKEHKALIQHALRSENAHRIDAMVKLAQSEEPIAVLAEAFDRDPALFNLANGTLDLATRTLRAHSREDLLSKLSPVGYDPQAECAEFLKFIKLISKGRPALQRYLQEIAGYSLTGDVSENCFFLLWGGGANGKTTLLELLFHIWGDYAMAAQFDTFLASSKSRGVRNDIARLNGARLVKASESDEDDRLSEGIIKQLTGNEVISARLLYQEAIDFRPQFKLWFSTQHKPKIKGTDHGMWRRVRLIPFEHQIPEAERDPNYGEKVLRPEASGVLNWALAGLRHWYETGLVAPSEVTEATETYRRSEDIVRRFIDDCLEVDPGLFNDGCGLEELNRRFAEWTRSEQINFKGRLSERLEALGYRRGRSNKKRYWQGIRIRKGEF